MSIEAMKQMVRALEDTSASKHISRNSAIQAGLKAIAEAEKQEPVSECVDDGEGGVYYKTLALNPPIGLLYTHPQPKREWVGLTEGERAECWYGPNCHEPKSPHDDYAIAIEAKLKEKNT